METNTVLIAYPPEFGCVEKFNRKISRILSTLENFKVVYLEDNRGLITDAFRNDQRVSRVENMDIQTLSSIDITHAIVFDDGVQFSDLLQLLERKSVIVRNIPVKITKVVNLDKAEPYDVYIGRGTPWGNPYAIGFSGDRNEVIRKFKYDFDRGFVRDGEEFKKRLRELAGKRLGCHCKPFACHGDVLAEYLNCLDDGA
jgi:hypothetical protein